MGSNSFDRKTVAQNARGFTLIETLVTLVILSIGFLVFASVTGMIMDTNNKSTHKSIATTLAQQKMESIIAIANDASLETADALANPAFDSDAWVSGDDESLNARGEASGKLKYTRSWTIVQEDTVGPEANLYNIKVNVTWEQKGMQAVTLLTRLSDKFG